MTPEILIGPIDADRDIDAILEIDRESFSAPWTRAMYEQELQGSRARILVARAPSGAVEGYCSYRVVLDEVHINNIAVRQGRRRQGIGRQLMDGVLAAGRAAGATSATLEVRESNAAALALYEELGFRSQGRRRRFYHDPDEDGLVLWAGIQAIGRGPGA